MQNTVIVFMALIHGGVFGRIQNQHEDYVSPRRILSKFSHRRGPRDLNTDNLQVLLELADLSGDIPSPCKNGGTLLHNIKKNTYVCQCSDKYGGRHCEINTRVCIEEENACKFYKNSFVTSDCRSVQGNGFLCYHHPPQYRKSWCRTEDTENNQAICPENWTCLDHILGKYQGYRCLPPGVIISPKSRGIRQSGIPEKCSCHNGGHCNKDATCVCLPHFTGLYCESQINYCNSNPCPLNIDCEPLLGGYTCNCHVLRGGPNCEETRRLIISTMVSPRFIYHASQHVSVPSTCLFYLEEIGTLPKLIIDFGDGTIVTMFKEDFHPTTKLNDILISFLYQPVDNKGTFYVVNYTHAYETEGLYNISLAAWNMQYLAMRNNFTVLVSIPENCEFSVKLTNAAATPDTATIYQRRHSINIHSVSTATCPGTRLKYSWALYAVSNIFTTHAPEMSRRSSPNIYTLISEFHVPPYVLSFGHYVLHLTVEMLEPAQGGNKSVITWFKIVKDDIIAHISGGNIRQVHKSRSFEIDASESYDPNSPFDSMRFGWTCSFILLKDMVPGFCDNESTIISNQPVLYVQQNVLKPNGVYIFKVKVESIEEDQSEKSIQVQVVSEDTELVQIKCVQNCLGNKVITTSPMALIAISPNHNDSMNYIWTFSYNNDTSDSSNAEIGYYSDGNNFVTKPGMLLPAQSYQISVRVENQNDAIKQMGTAAINLFTYPALTVGFCIISPSQGYALITTFQIKCFRFIANYLPVTYEIFQYRLPKEEPIMIGFGVSGEFNNITLAAGLPENDYSTALRVYASDSKGNFGFYEQDITVFPVAVYTNLNDELAIVKKLTFGTASAIVTNLANQEVQSVIQTILTASCSVHTLSQELRHTIRSRKSGSDIQDPILQDQINTIVQFKDTMVEYLSHCELRSPIIAKYCSSTLTSILACDYNGILTNRPDVPYANRKAVNVLDNIVEMLHKITQESQDTTVVRTDVLDIGTTILTSVSLLLKKPKGHGVEMLLSRRLDNSHREHLGEDKIVIEWAEQEIELAKQTEAVINSMNDYASLFARYMAPHEDDYLTNPTEDICISIQKTNRGIKTATLPAYVDVNVSIISNDSNTVYDLQVITMKNNPYWWEKSAEHMNFPLIKVDVFNTIKEPRSRIARVGASQKHENRRSSSPVIHGADIKFLSPQENSLGNIDVIQGSVALKPTWNYTDSDIAIHKLELRTGGKSILIFDDQGDGVLLRVVVKENAPPDLNDFWESRAIPKFEEINLTKRQKRSIFLDSENNTEEYTFYYVGILPHQATIRSLLHDIDSPVPDSFLYKEPPPKPNKQLKANDHITYSFKAYNAQCLRWNTLNRRWTNHCKVLESDLTETTVSCHCDGLSTIGASFRAANELKSPRFGLSQFIKLIDNSLIFWFLVYITVCFLGLFAWGGMRDRRDKKHDKLIVLDDNKAEDTYNYVILVQTDGNLDPSTSSRVAVILEGSEGNSSVHVLNSVKRQVMLGGARDYFVLRTSRSLGDVFCLHLWHNHKGQIPIWYIGTIIVHDVQTHHVSVFIFETWLSPLDKDGRMGLSCYRMLNNEILSLKMRLKNAIADIMDAGYHSWLGMCSRHLPRNNTRRRRVVLAFVHTCVLMASVTAFYPLPTYSILSENSDTREKFTFEWEEVIVGIVAATIGFSVNCIFFGIAKNVAPAQSYTTNYPSRYVEELVIPIPAKPNIIGANIPSDKKILMAKEIQLTNSYKPGEMQVIGKRTVPLRVPEAHSQPTVYDEVISLMGPIQAFQRIRFAYSFSHIFLYPLWILLGVVLLMALYFILFYATFYTWSIGLRYLFATWIGLLFSFSILEPSKVIVIALLRMRRQKGALVIDDRSRIALYMTHNSDTTQLGSNRTAAIYKPPIV